MPDSPATTFDFYADNTLSSRVSRMDALFPESAPNAPAAPALRQVWLGSRAANLRLRPPDSSNFITVQITGTAAENIRLATTQQGLASATPGAALSLPDPIRAPIPLWLQLTATPLAVGVYPASLTLTALEEQRP